MVYMKNDELNVVIERIIKMEFIFDTLQQNIDHKNEFLFQNLYNQLIEYYESDDWKEDYQLDELGLLPSDLKRGVLSQDGIYNFLTSIEID